MAAATRLSTTPTRTMVDMRRRPLPNTIALGGVAIGSMNAQLLAIVTGTTRSKGFMSQDSAIWATTGTMTTVSAKLLITSVRKSETSTNPAMSKPGDMAGTDDTHWATASNTPASLSCPAKVSPPPKRSRMSHGKRAVSDHASSAPSC